MKNIRFFFVCKFFKLCSIKVVLLSWNDIFFLNPLMHNGLFYFFSLDRCKVRLVCFISIIFMEIPVLKINSVDPDLGLYCLPMYLL